MFRKLATTAFTLGLLCSALPATSLAQNFPTKAVRIVTPYPAGGSTDMFLRILSQKMQESTGQPFVIDAKPGGATMIATVTVKNAAPDGYTMLTATSLVPNNLLMYKKADYKMEDFAPVSLFASGPLAMSVSKSVAARSTTPRWAPAAPLTCWPSCCSSSPACRWSRYPTRARHRRCRR